MNQDIGLCLTRRTTAYATGPIHLLPQKGPVQQTGLSRQVHGPHRRQTAKTAECHVHLNEFQKCLSLSYLSYNSGNNIIITAEQQQCQRDFL